MHIADKHIAEFRMLYRKNFGEDITKEEALDRGIRLVRLMEIVAKYEVRRGLVAGTSITSTNNRLTL